MNCWHCKHEVIWESDYDIDNDMHSMITILGCPSCGSTYEVYYPREGHEWKEIADE